MRHVDQRRLRSRQRDVCSSGVVSEPPLKALPSSYIDDGLVRGRTAPVMCAGAMPKSARGSDIRLVPNFNRSVALGTRMLIRSGGERGSAPWASEGVLLRSVMA